MIKITNYLALAFLFHFDSKSISTSDHNKETYRHLVLPSNQYQTILLKPNETKVIYYYINLKGTVFYKISNKSGTNKINCWWVKGPFGSIESIGSLISQGSIPFKGLIWGKLKASGADSETKVLITERASVASNFPSIQF